MESVLEFNAQFSTDGTCRQYLADIRWGRRPKCPHCGRRKAYDLAHSTARPGLYKCARCRREYTVTVGTIFEDSHVPLPKWFLAIYLIVNAKKGISTNSLSRLLGLTYKTTWFLTHRIRHTMEPINQRRLRGVVEADETYVGGRHRGGKRGRGSESKTPLLALVQRDGGVRTQVVEHVDAQTLKTAIRASVAPSTVMMTDEWGAYRGLRREFKGHRVVKHNRGEFARRGAHVNTAESFFALLKRGMYGTFHHVSKKHLHRYANEFGFRWTYKGEDGFEQFKRLLGQAVGRRLAYRIPKSKRMHSLINETLDQTSTN